MPDTFDATHAKYLPNGDVGEILGEYRVNSRTQDREARMRFHPERKRPVEVWVPVDLIDLIKTN